MEKWRMERLMFQWFNLSMVQSFNLITFYPLPFLFIETQTLEIATNVAPQVMASGMMGLILILVLREMVRKGIALRKAGTQKQLPWFIVMFIFNTAGILPIIYLIFFQKKGKK